MSENQEVVELFADICRDTFDMPRLLELAERDDVPTAGQVKVFVDAGVLGLAVPEDLGGVGLGVNELTEIAMHAGENLLPWHLFAAIFGGVPAIAAAGDDVDDVIGGDVSVALAVRVGDRPSKPELLTWRTSTEPGRVVVIDGPETVDAAAGVEPLPGDTLRVGLEPGQGMLTIGAPAVPSTSAAVPEAAARRIVRIWRLALCAQAWGCANALLERSVAYAKEREQFGAPIATFQAVAHTLADMHVGVAAGLSALGRVSRLIDDGDAAVDRELASLESWLLTRSRRVCEQAVQVHGGTGFTWEQDSRGNWACTCSTAASW
ncbi:acyl-CoA dehydrogenase family protein [Granulicoccus phenolivorans]|uniref:acyl-CoA dehydrogenase family protein n=1 Tax=Granulicoccus phenolivorans TaxID=266854 RepID=UPI0003F4FA05|nr:acyl-CoA dehydrogenase family protein [Granulicoccus phenolivorans]